MSVYLKRNKDCYCYYYYYYYCQGLGSVYQETRAQATSNFVCHCCWLLHCTLWRCLWTLCSLLAEALFLVFVDGRKETSAMGRKCLWFNRRPQSWTALFETHAPSVVRWPQLAPVGSRSILYINSAVIYWAHIVNMACSSAFSKEFNRKELQNLLSSVLDNLNDGKVKKLSDEQLRGVTTLTNAVWAILGLNLSRPGNLDHPPEFWGYIPGCPDFFLHCPGIIACFPEKFPSVPIPGEISRFPEQFWLCPETAFVRVVTPREQFKAPFHFLNGRDTFACLPIGHWLWQ